MTWNIFLPYLLVMAGVTYLVRMLPMTLFRKPIRSRFVKSFLHYVPFAVLTAMTIPDILFSTGYTPGGDVKSLVCAVVGLLFAIFMAWRKKGLLTVAVTACLAVLAAQGVCLLF
ncbi:MAG: AzlD domain-containing protein [Clostridia bacterium]|nr:AzlD domain-containing protein [Clostridia bacterium]